MSSLSTPFVTMQGSRSEPVSLQAVEDEVASLASRFDLREVIFESPQAVASVQRLQGRLSRAEVRARWPTAETQATLFGNLYRLFANRLLRLFPHEQLRREALNLATRTVGG